MQVNLAKLASLQRNLKAAHATNPELMAQQVEKAKKMRALTERAFLAEAAYQANLLAFQKQVEELTE